MQTSRQRRELLFLMVLSALGGEARHKKGYELLKVRGPFMLMHKVEKKLQVVVPIEKDRKKEIASAKKVVNDFLPAGFLLWRPELKLWFACQVIKRLVATGWRPPQDEEVAEYVQGMYDLADNINMVEPPSIGAIELVAHSGDVLRAKYGLFN